MPRYFVRLVILVPLGIGILFAVSVSVVLVRGPYHLGPHALRCSLSFVPQAVTMAEESPVRALWSSFRRTHGLWSALGLILLTNLIGTGMSAIWRTIMDTSGMVVAILGNAYIGSGLTAAAFILPDRVAMWRELQQQKEMNTHG